MIVAIELTLAFNSISGVYTMKSTGQLIPFVIGVGGLWTVLNDLMTDYYKVSGDTAVPFIYISWS